MTGSIVDVPGLAVGHASLGDTGVTVVRVTDPAGAVASVDVRRGGPGTRETDLLAPENTVERVHAVVLSGGSAFGLAAADGVMRALAEQQVGFAPLGEGHPARVPIVPAAVIFDLAVGSADHFPSPADGRAALADSVDNHSDARGSVGAGCGASAGRLRGGFGQAAVTVGEHTVAAAVVANPVGEVVDPMTGRFWADEDRAPVDPARMALLHAPDGSLNTTIGVVATDAPLTKAQARRVAMVAHDGIARAVRPAHSPLDGDTLFALSTAPVAAAGTGVQHSSEHAAGTSDPVALARIGEAGAEAVAAAIVDAVANAAPGDELPVTAYEELL